MIRQANTEKAIDVALTCFMTYGINATTQSALSKESGLSLRSINRFFKDKDDLILRMMEKLARQISDYCALACSTMHKSKHVGSCIARALCGWSEGMVSCESLTVWIQARGGCLPVSKQQGTRRHLSSPCTGHLSKTDPAKDYGDRRGRRQPAMLTQM